MKLKKRIRQKIKEKRIGSRDKKRTVKRNNATPKCVVQLLTFLCQKISLKINSVWSSLACALKFGVALAEN